MATELGKAYIQIMPSAKGISGMIQKEITNPLSQSGAKVGGLFNKGFLSKFMSLKTLITGSALGVAISKSLTEGAKLQQTLGGIETLFKDNADKVKAYANEAYKTAGLSANQYMETVTGFSASLLQSLGGDTAKAADIANMALIDMADNSNKFGTSMESIQYAYQGFARQNYTMLDNLKLGYSGTKNEMERLLKDAEKLTGVKYDINNLSDVYKAIHAIQKKLEITGTTAKEASSTFTGSFASMKSALSNFLGSLSLGQDVLPALKNLGDTIVTFVVGNLIPMLLNILESISQIMVAGVYEIIPSILNAISQMIDDVLILLFSNPDEFFRAGGQLINDLLCGISSKFQDLIIYVADGIVRLVSSILGLGARFVLAGLALIGHLTSGIVQSIPKAVGAIFDLGQQIISEAFKIDLFAAGKAILDGFLGGLKAAWDGVANFVGGIADWIAEHKGPISYDKILLIPAGKAIMQGLNKGLEDNFKTVKRTVKNMSGEISKSMSSVVDTDMLDSSFSLNSQVQHSLQQNHVFIPENVYTSDTTNHKKDDIIIENVIVLDGKVLGRGIAKFTNDEIKTQQKITNRMFGILGG